MSYPHYSVLLEEILHAFSDKHIRTFVDGTLGAGGHAEAILQAHPEIELYIGIDQDPDALKIAAERLAPWKDKLALCPGNFAQMDSFLQLREVKSVDGILLDLGVSSMQFDRAEKGFSFMRDGPLDMRMDPQAPLTAAEIVNTWSEQDLGRLFREYAEEKKWRQAARTIVSARSHGNIETTLQLVEVLRAVFPEEPVWKRKKKIHPMTLIFQGLRICVNSELEVLSRVLPKAIAHLARGGRLAVISFHSLEDRIVKNILRFAADDKYDTSGLGGLFRDKIPEVELVTRKPLCPSEAEMEKNPRSRSAKLRIVEKV